MASTGRLLVVGTPLGNLGDFSERAKEALTGADLILAEDTRHSRPLLDIIGATAKAISCHQHNEEERLKVVLERLEAGDTVALITDAGAPAVSDPGGKIVEGVAAKGGHIEVIPGPSAPIAALMGAGLDTTRFTFLGFLPRKGRSRVDAMKAAAESGHALILFEAANRVEATLADLAETCGRRRVVVARELTKKFETFHRGVLGGDIDPPFVDKGEVVIVVEGGEGEAIAPPGPSVEERAQQLAADATLSPRDRAKALGAEFHLSRKEAYRRILEAAEAEPSDAEPSDAAPSDVESGRSDKDAPVPTVQDAPPPRSLEEARQRVRTQVAVTAASRAEVRQSLDDAGRALLRAYAAAGGKLGAEASGDDVSVALAVMLESPRRMPAPSEVNELLRALLASLGAAEALDEAIEMMADAMGDG